MEKSVKIMESYALSLIETVEDVKSPEKREEITQEIEDMFATVAKNTDGTVAYYLRYDPKLSNSTAGFFYDKPKNSVEYIRLNPTDLSLYDKTDMEHVGWFWVPYEAGAPIWLAPYYNQNNDILMISYIIPLYCDNQFIGVVGLDFDYTLLTQKVSEIKLYDHGCAHLELDGAILYDGHEPSQNDHADDSSEKYLHASEKLENGMTLVLAVSYEDAFQIRYSTILTILLCALLIVFVFSLVIVYLVKTIIVPLKKLTDAATKISNKDYHANIPRSNIYEIHALSSAFDTMTVNLREHAKMQHLLSHRDPLTKIRNTTSYQDWEFVFNHKIKEQNIEFGIVMFDINNLKNTNDAYGHLTGNQLIQETARLIADTFKRSPTFRVGGDEFVVILQDRDLEERDMLLAEFDERCKKAVIEANDTKIPLVVAKGYSLFDPNADTQMSDVFKRADHEMYANKKELKSADK